MSIYLGEKRLDKENTSSGGGSNGIEIGDIGIAPFGIDESQNLRRYLNGQIINQAQFTAFTNKLKTVQQSQANLFITEENWQTEIANSKFGQCGKFVIDNTAGTIRLPKIINIQNLQDFTLLGNTVPESLPNIKSAGGGIGGRTAFGIGSFAPFVQISTANAGQGAGDKARIGPYYGFNASTVCTTYQDNASVQQEAVLYPYFIQVALTNSGTITVNPGVSDWEQPTDPSEPIL